jgi:hypothetical protein
METVKIRKEREKKKTENRKPEQRHEIRSWHWVVRDTDANIWWQSSFFPPLKVVV